MENNIKKTRRWLNSYRILKKTVILKEKHLNEFVIDMYNPLKAATAKLAKEKGCDQESALNILKKISNIYLEIIEDLNKDITNIKQSIQEIFDIINSLDNYERSVCFSRYILGSSWNEIGEQLGYEARQCQRYEEKALKKINEMLMSKKYFF